MRSAQPVVCALFAALVAAPAARGAAPPRTIGSVTAQTPIAAHAGWAVWSIPDGNDRFALRAWHDGSAGTLSVGDRREPFDIDVGTDAHGQPVATFSRCAAASVQLTPSAKTAAGCRLRVLDLTSGTERRIRVPHPADASDTVPSMWRGNVAFARRDGGQHKYVPQILLWSAASHRLTVLRHGRVPTHCPAFGKVPCPRGQVVADVPGLDLGAKLASIQWEVSASDNAIWDYPESFTEIRAEQLARHRSTVLMSQSYDREYCGDGVEVIPYSPTVDGDVVSYSQATGRCSTYSKQLVRSRTPFLVPALGPLASGVGQVAVDGRDVYAFVFPKAPRDEPVTCDRPGQPCLIRRLAMPRLSRAPAP